MMCDGTMKTKHGMRRKSRRLSMNGEEDTHSREHEQLGQSMSDIA